MQWHDLARPSYSYSLSLAVWPSLVSPYASTSPTRPTWTPFYQRSIYLDMQDLIFLDRRTLNVFVIITQAKTRGISELQLLLRTPQYSVTRIDVKRLPTAPWVVAYHLPN